MYSIVLALQDAVAQGILWAVMALGVYITFKVLNFADMTVDGSFALGGCVSAVVIVEGISLPMWFPFHKGPVLGIVVAVLAGVLAGLITGLLHTVLKIPAILSGILTQLALYSINLRIMGRSNIPLLKSVTMVDMVKRVLPLSTTWVVLIIGVIVVIITVLFLYMFFGTEIGSAIRATGNNEDMVRALGVNTNVTKVLALMLANGLVALSGALVTQSQGYADISMGIGTIVIGLASIVIGEVFLGKVRSFGSKLIAVVIGSIVYRSIIAVVLQLGLTASDLKLLTAVIVATALAIPTLAKGKRD